MESYVKLTVVAAFAALTLTGCAKSPLAPEAPSPAVGPGNVPPLPAGIPQIRFTKFLMFGDSITEGKLSDGTILTTGSYPQDLFELLQSRYTSQPIWWDNEGCGGEAAGLPTLPGHFCPDEQPLFGEQRIGFDLMADKPQVVLLQEGANDLTSDDPSAIPPLISALRSMVIQAKASGAVVFLGTLLPQRLGGKGMAPDLIAPANAQISTMAAAEGVTLVDLYQALGSSPDPYIGVDPDGLHPTEAGYQVISQAFFDAIKTQLEIPAITSHLPSAGADGLGRVQALRAPASLR